MKRYLSILFCLIALSGLKAGPLQLISYTPNGLGFTYSSDGDVNGIIYYIGTGYGNLGTFTNPHLRYTTNFQGPNGINTGTIASWTDRLSTGDYVSANSVGEYELIDLGTRTSVDTKASITKYSLRNRGTNGADNSRAIRNWKLQGSNNVATPISVANVTAATWADIDVRTADTTMATTSAAWGTYTPNQSNTTKYRFLRIISTGANAFGDNFLCVGEIEFYGALDVSPNPAVGGNSTTLTYSSDGDANGLMTFFGTKYTTVTWAQPFDAGSNPYTSAFPSMATMSVSGFLAGQTDPPGITDHGTGHVHVTIASGGWVKWDFGAGRSLVLTRWNLRNRDNSGDGATSVIVEGSNDNSSWTSLSSVTGRTVTANAWAGGTSANATSWRYIRITDRDASTYWTIGEIELYGTFTY